MNQPGFLPAAAPSFEGCVACDAPHPQLRMAVWVLLFVQCGVFAVACGGYAMDGARLRAQRQKEALNETGLAYGTNSC